MSADHETIRLRGEILRADSATLEAARRERGIDFQDADAELRSMVLTVNERFTHADLERWVWHPDELVPITLARLYGTNPEVRSVLVRRALEDARRDDNLWTPLLDALADAASKDRDFFEIQGFARRLTRLHSWIRAVENPTELEVLASFGSSAICYAQLEKARVIPESTLSHWIRTLSDAHLVLGNRQIMRRHAPAVLLAILDLPPKDVLELGVLFEETLSPNWFAHADEVYADRLLDRALEVARRLHYNGNIVLGHLINCLPRIRPERIEAMLHDPIVQEYDFPQVSLVLHPCAPPSLSRWQILMQRHLVHALVEHPAAPGDLLQAAWHEFGTSLASRLLTHPNTPENVALEVVRSWKDWRKPGTKIRFSTLPPRIVLEMLRLHDRPQFARMILRVYAKRASLARKPYYSDVIGVVLDRVIPHVELDRPEIEALALLAKRGILQAHPRSYAHLLQSEDPYLREQFITALDAPKRQASAQHPVRWRRRK